MFTDLQFDLIEEIFGYLKPNLQIPVSYDKAEKKFQELEEFKKLIQKLLTINKLFNGIITEVYLKEFLYFPEEINLKIVNKYRSKQLISIRDNKLKDKDLKTLANLTSLTLVRNKKVTDEGIKPLTNLTSLDLGYNTNVTNEMREIIRLRYTSNS